MKPVLAEPALYVYAGNQDGRYSDVSFKAFYRVFERLKKFIELNNACIFTSAEIYKATEKMFPYSTISSKNRERNAKIWEEASVVTRFLEKHIDKPLRDYKCGDDRTSFGDGFERNAPVYADDDVWISWKDLIVQVVSDLHGCAHQRELLTTDCEQSCVTTTTPALIVKLNDSSQFELRICRATEHQWPTGFIDPQHIELIEAMRARRGRVPKDPDIDYEKSGHQAPVSIKRVLERTAKDKRVLERTAKEANGIVLRMNTTYFNPEAPSRCKLEAHIDVAQIKFTVSDGQATVVGYFTTNANSVTEQKAAKWYLDRIFREQCDEYRMQCD